jgi:hypothetical protein
VLLSQECDVIVDPSTEAAFPTRMLVQQSQSHGDCRMQKSAPDSICAAGDIEKENTAGAQSKNTTKSLLTSDFIFMAILRFGRQRKTCEGLIQVDLDPTPVLEFISLLVNGAGARRPWASLLVLPARITLDAMKSQSPQPLNTPAPQARDKSKQKIVLARPPSASECGSLAQELTDVNL